MMRLSILGILLLVVATAACEGKSARAEAAVTAVATPSAASSTQSGSPLAKVNRIVFIGKAHPCDCTRKKQDTATAALDKLLGVPPRIPIESIQIDAEPTRAEPYRKIRPMMAVPALYFLDGQGGLIDLLQGEISEAQIAQLLDGRA
jgi:hypothetical protein